MDIKGKSYKFIISRGKRVSFWLSLSKWRTWLRYHSKSICSSYKPYCRGIIKGSSVIDSFFFQMCLANHMKKTVSFHLNILVLRASICHVCTIYSCNWTEWSAVWAEIIRVISKSSEHTVQVQFEIRSMILD